MSFKPLEKTTRPARRWGVKGLPGGGKSSLLTQAEGPLLVIDTDRRFADVAHLTTSTVLRLSDDDADLSDVRAIDRLIAENARGSGIKSAIVDSVTPIVQRIIRRKSLEEAAGEGERNKSAAHKEKADTMALLIDAVGSAARDVYFVWHMGHNVMSGQRQATETLPKTEQERLRRHLNAEIEVFVEQKEPKRRGVRVVYCRTNASAEGQVLWDTPENLAAGTHWKGMMERLDAIFTSSPPPKATALPAAPAAATPARTVPTPTTPAQDAPAARSFKDAADAIAWGAKELQFSSDEISAVYEEVKKKVNPKSAKEMWAAWVAEVEARKQTLASASF